jgi:hypothetical protein
MSIELYQISAVVVSGTVTLTWTQPPGQSIGPVTSYAVQRKPFGYGQDQWATVSTQSPATAPTPNTYSEAPGTGDWSYRVQATVTQGGVDNGGTAISSIEVNVTTEATTGAVTLVLGSGPAGDPAGYTKTQLGWYIAGTAVDVKHYEIQRSLSGGPFRSVGEVDEFENLHWEEVLQNGTGLVTYQVVAHLPSATPPYQASVLSTSNQVSVTI